MKRSIGITIIGWAEIVGILFLWAWIFLMVGINSFTTPQLLVQIAYSSLGILTGVGLLMLKKWAHMLVIVLSAGKIVEMVIKFAHSFYSNKFIIVERIPDFFILAVCMIIILYLSKRSVRTQFS